MVKGRFQSTPASMFCGYGETVDTTDLKSVEIYSRAGSSPAIRTNSIQ